MDGVGPSTPLDEVDYAEEVQPIAEQVESGRQAASRTLKRVSGNWLPPVHLPGRRRSRAAEAVDKYYVIDSSKIKRTGTNEDDANAWFSTIIKLQKSGGNMFLFGKITPKIFKIVERIYHENLSRVVLDNAAPGFMLGILEDHNGNIYMAISEDPYEDSKFIPKIKSLYQMLKNANINVQIEEDKVQEYVAGSDTDNYRSPEDPAYDGLDIDITNSTLNGKPIKMFVKNDNDYEKNDLISVFLVNSEKYLAERKKGWAYPPVKKFKYDAEARNFYHECNNGSTCVEAKLFSYFYNLYPNKKFENIKGFASYWVEKKLPPDHYMPKYSYCLPDKQHKAACETTDNDKLTQMTRDILKQADVNIQPETFDTYKIIWQPLALSCPGCLLNWSNYKNNRMHKFNYKTCAPPRLTFDEMIYYDPTIPITTHDRRIGRGLKKRLNVKKVKTQRRKQQSNKRRKTRRKTNTLRIRNKINYKTKKSNNI